jgi:hypothetical protein
MYATVRRYEGVIDSAEVGRRVAEGFLPIIREVPGFVAYTFADAGGGVMVSTSVFEDLEATKGIFEDREGVAESNRRAADWVRENIAELLPNPPEITAGEVVAHA